MGENGCVYETRTGVVQPGPYIYLEISGTVLVNRSVGTEVATKIHLSDYDDLPQKRFRVDDVLPDSGGE